MIDQPAEKLVRFKDPTCKAINVPHIGEINETHLSNAAVIKVIKRNSEWFAQYFTEE